MRERATGDHGFTAELAGGLWHGDGDAVRGRIAQKMDQWVKASAKETAAANTGRDPLRPKWALVPRGETCAWCTMLASRGWAYTSEDAAKASTHPDCDCQPVPDWGDGMAGYDPGRYAALYDAAVEAADPGASREEILSRMRAQGGVADSPATQAGSDGGGKPPKPPKATAAVPQPDEPGRRNGRMWRPGLEGEQERRDSCRQTLDAGGLLSHDEYLSERRRLGFDMDFDEWVDSQIQTEIATRTPEWISRGVIGTPEADEDAAPSKDELLTAKSLEAWGVSCRFHKDWYEIEMPDGTKLRRGLADLGDGIELKMFKNEGGKNTVGHALENAGKKKGCTCVIFDNTVPGAGYDDAQLLEKIKENKHASRASVYSLGKDGSFVKVRNPII